MNINDQAATRRFVDGMGARLLASRLHAALADNTSMYLTREMEAGSIRLSYVPPIKEVIREVAFMERTPMADFARQAVIEKVQRILADKIKAMEEDDAT